MTRTARQRRTDPTSRRATVDAVRHEQQRQHRRRQLLLIAGSSVAVLVVVAVIVGIGLGSKSGSDSTGAERTPATQALRVVSAVPAATINAVAGGKATPPTGVGDAALTSDGKPEILYVGAEYCPYCAAERWPLVQALTRFGTFSNLSLTTSASDDVHPNTPTFSFHGATYSSPYLSFVGKELYTNKRVGGVYEPLDKLTDAEQQIFQAHTQGFPFIDVGGRYVVTGATYESGVLDGQSAPAIAAALANPDSATAQGVIGAANRITAAICQVTGGKPANVCTAPGVAKLAAQVAQ